jgi:septum formation protein
MMVMKAVSAASSLLILGSGSSTRRAILSEMGLAYEIHKPDIDEKAIRRTDPADLVLALGRAKAAALLEGPQAADFAARRAFILTADQVVVWKGQILEKPENEAEARAFIAGYAESPPRTVGSCVISCTVTGKQWTAVDEACVVRAHVCMCLLAHPTDLLPCPARS